MAILALIFMAFFTTQAWAHSQFISQYPAASSVIIELPGQVEIVFNENLLDLGNGNELQMLDPQGNEVTMGEVSISNATLTRSLIESSQPGEYYVSYRAVSSDGHVVAGEYMFTLSPESVAVQPTPLISATPAVADTSNLTKIFGISSFMLLLCGFILWRFRARKSRITSSQ